MTVENGRRRGRGNPGTRSRDWHPCQFGSCPRILTLLCAALCAAGVSCDSKGPAAAKPQTLVVFCGAGIRPAMEQVKAAFEQQHEGVTVSVNYAGSGTLLGQLEAGGPADVYVPGDVWWIK